MSRSERLSSPREIHRTLKVADGKNKTGGPILYVDHGKRYYDDSEAHIKVQGNTGVGKTVCGVIPTIRNIIDAGESFAVIDSKGNVYTSTWCEAQKKHKVIVLDFRNPATSPDQFNPLLPIASNVNSSDVVDRDRGRSQTRDFTNSICMGKNAKDVFWDESSARFISGLIYLLFEKGEESQINFSSIASMMDEANEKPGFSSTTMLKSIYDELSSNSNAKRDLATYVTAPNETRGSIHSVASSAFSLFNDSEGLSHLLSKSTFDLNNFDVSKPFAFYIILPDEDDVYDGVAGLIFTMFTKQLIKIAQNRYNGRLPIRTNLVVDELGSVGKSIPNLPNLMSASRSRNIRIMVGLQSDKQLVSIYGEANAETINSCFGITMAFSTNDRNLLREYSERLGKKEVMVDGKLREEYLATPTQIEAMPRCMALIFVENNLKFFSKLPRYDQMYDLSDWKKPGNGKGIGEDFFIEDEVFSIKEEVNKKKKIKENREPSPLSSNRTSSPIAVPSFEEFVEMRERHARDYKREMERKSGDSNTNKDDGENLDIDKLMEKIDAKLIELEKEEVELPRDVTLICRGEIRGDILAEITRRRIIPLSHVDTSGKNVIFHAKNDMVAQKLQKIIREMGGSCRINILEGDDEVDDY